MRNTLSLFSLLAILLAFGCNTPKAALADKPIETEVRDLDTMTVTPAANGIIEGMENLVPREIPNERPVYRAAYNRTHDLLHTRLDLRFDWSREMVIGKATLRFTPIFKLSDQLVLDAKNFDFKSIKTAAGKDLSYDYTGDKQRVTITLDRKYQRGEEYTIVLDYTAIPAQSGGSAAITSDKGLFFINADGTEDKPQQIWTQGETENNSRWFPTIDKPNERTTQEMYVTVQDKYVTLSNGSRISSTKNADGTRTDYWKMDLPHAPYLFALIVGEFDVVEDQAWNGIPVNYYMEDGFKDYAKKIYPHTREMLTFFSDITGTPYPWAKYSQVAVRDYVSGAMENTTAVIFGEFMHGTDRDLIDVETNEKIVAHEMFHHWFGDYVTCESWSNLTLNEGFANYSEYLWLEKKHGRDAADAHMMDERGGYFGSVRRGEPHELIWYDYDDKEQMFDAHSYNKGGAVLHMLRGYVGDEAFFASLKKYLSDNKYSAVEVDELRMAFEDTTGEDLKWFFNQWFLSAGHPALKLETDYADGKVMLTVEQTQDTENNVPGVFRLPTQVAIYTNGSTTPMMKDIWIDERKQTFTFPVSVSPDVVVLDPKHELLAEFDYTKSAGELAAQFRGATSVVDRMLVLQRLGGKDAGAEKTAILTAALSDPFHGVRGMALQALESPTAEQKTLVISLAENDPHSKVRAAAIGMLTAIEVPELNAIATQALDARPYAVVAAGLQALMQSDPTAASEAAAKLEDVENSEISGVLAGIYAASGDPARLPFFEKQMMSISGFGAIELYEGYRTLLARGSAEQMTAGIAKMSAMGLDQSEDPWRRIAATKALNDMREEAKAAGKTESVASLGKLITAIKAKETLDDLKQIYQQFGN